MSAERIKVRPRRISVAGQEVWSVGVVAPVCEETGWGCGPTCNIAYMHALSNLATRLATGRRESMTDDIAAVTLAMDSFTVNDAMPL